MAECTQAPFKSINGAKFIGPDLATGFDSMILQSDALASLILNPFIDAAHFIWP